MRILSTELRIGSIGTGAVEVGNWADVKNYISLFQDDDLVLIYRDQIDELIEELKKFKENA